MPDPRDWLRGWSCPIPWGCQVPESSIQLSTGMGYSPGLGSRSDIVPYAVPTTGLPNSWNICSIALHSPSGLPAGCKHVGAGEPICSCLHGTLNVLPWPHMQAAEQGCKHTGPSLGLGPVPDLMQTVSWLSTLGWGSSSQFGDLGLCQADAHSQLNVCFGTGQPQVWDTCHFFWFQAPYKPII